MEYISQIKLPNGSTYNLRDKGVSNENLVDNPDFSVNQRQHLTYTCTAGGVLSCYTVDRWKMSMSSGASGDCILTSDPEGITFESTSPQSVYLIQKIEFPERLKGNTITLTAKLMDGTITSASKAIPKSVSSGVQISVQAGAAAVQLAFVSGALCWRIRLTGESSVSLAYIKAEYGDTATAFTSPNYAVELIKCQRYYQVHSTGDIAIVDLRPSMAQIVDIKQKEEGKYEYIADFG